MSNMNEMRAIDLTDTAYKFGVDIKRTRSQGIGYMKIFCYDLMIAQIQAELVDSPGFLIPDSTIVNGVNERQVEKALELGVVEAAEKGFQHIVTLDLDQAPFRDFIKIFKDECTKVVRIKFTDAADNGELLCIRF